MADVHKAAALRARFEQRVAQAELQARLANGALASFWTDQVDGELEVVDELDRPPEPPVEAGQAPPDVRQLISRRPELAQLEALQRQYQAEAKAARAELRPQASVVFQYGMDANRVWVRDRGYAVFVNLDIPLFDWFQSRSRAHQAEYKRTAVLQQAAMARRQFSQEYWAAATRVQSCWRQASYARQEMEHSRENLRLARLLFESGEGSALDVVTAQINAVDSAVAYHSALAEYSKAIVDFQVASGK